MKKNVKLMIFLMIFRAIIMKMRNFAMSKDKNKRQESQKVIDNI